MKSSMGQYAESNETYKDSLCLSVHVDFSSETFLLYSQSINSVSLLFANMILG